MNKPLQWLLGITLTLIAVFCVLAFGNPQWHKQVYLFQANGYYLSDFKRIPAPKNYSGVWRDWNQKRVFFLYRTFQNGLMHGELKRYDDKGVLIYKANYHSGKQIGFDYIYKNGKLQTIFKKSPRTVPIPVYFPEIGIDRRKEFGIPIK